MTRARYVAPVTVVGEEPEEDLGTIVIHISKNPAQPMWADIIGTVTHKHVLASNNPILVAFRKYMSDMRTKLLQEKDND
jgi:hypothetical protein